MLGEYYDYPSDGAAVSPDDGNDLPKIGILYIGVAGTLRVNLLSGVTVNFTVPVGIFRIPVKRVHNTGTSATGIVALYARGAD